MNDPLRAVVVENKDPSGKGRVRVESPTMGTGWRSGSGWAPVLRPFGSGRAAIPSVGDQVLLAFEAGDFSHPIVLGRIT